MDKILDEQYIDLIVDNATIAPTQLRENITPINERESILHVRSENPDMCMLGRYPYHSFPSIFTLASLVSLEASGVRSLQLNPYLALYGQGVLVGIIDTGIDYQHPAFINNDRTTRIVSIWDQTIQDGTPPQGFTYGTEYTSEVIDIALQNENPLSVVPSTDVNGHGTAIASVMAGNTDAANSFSGIVPQSRIIVVKLKEAKQNLRELFLVPSTATCYQESDIMLATRYILEVARSLNQPLSLCIALACSQSGHSGEGSTSTYLDYLAKNPWIGITSAAGNEGNARRHYFANVTTAPFTNEFELRVSSLDSMFSMEIWTSSTGSLTLEIISPTGESTQLIYPRLRDCVSHEFLLSSSIVWVNNILLEQESGNQCILIRMRNPLEGIWIFKVQNLSTESFTFHSWLPSGDLISKETFFLQSSPETTVTAPGNAQNVLTISAYNQDSNSILIESGRGYTSIGLVKPDLAAPGYQLTCANLVGGYGSSTGTGAAAAHSAGIVAMLLEWGVIRGNYSQITGRDINRMLIRGANRADTTTYPNNIWGFGRIDINGVFQKMTI